MQPLQWAQLKFYDLIPLLLFTPSAFRQKLTSIFNIKFFNKYCFKLSSIISSWQNEKFPETGEHWIYSVFSNACSINCFKLSEYGNLYSQWTVNWKVLNLIWLFWSYSFKFIYQIHIPEIIWYHKLKNVRSFWSNERYL